MLKNIMYRKLRPEESAIYREIRLESLKNYPNSFGSQYEEQKQRPKLSFETFIEDANSECIIVGAVFEDSLIGICGLYQLQDSRSRHRAEIIQMYVKPEYQGNKVGYNLLKETIRIGFEIDTVEQIELEVMTDVNAANHIYEKAGFTECGIRQNIYKIDGNYFDQRMMILYRD